MNALLCARCVVTHHRRLPRPAQVIHNGESLCLTCLNEVIASTSRPVRTPRTTDT